MTVAKEMMDSIGKFLDEATAGVNDGSITKQNLAAKFQELQKKHLGDLTPAAAPSRPPGTVEPGF